MSLCQNLPNMRKMQKMSNILTESPSVQKDQAMLICILSLVMGCLASSVGAAIIFQDDFEGQPLGAGLWACTPPIGQSYNGPLPSQSPICDSATNPPGGGAGGSLQFTGGTNVRQSMYISAADKTNATGKVVTFSADLYMMAGSSAQGVETAAFNATPNWYSGSSFDVLVRADGTAAYYDDTLTNWHNVTGTFQTDAWVSLEVIADYTAHTYQATLDGITWTANFTGYSAPMADTVGLFSLAPVNASSTYFVDNVSVTIIPEPASLALLGLAVVTLLRRHR